MCYSRGSSSEQRGYGSSGDGWSRLIRLGYGLWPLTARIAHEKNGDLISSELAVQNKVPKRNGIIVLSIFRGKHQRDAVMLLK